MPRHRTSRPFPATNLWTPRESLGRSAMLEFVVYLAIAGFIGVTLLGHFLVLRALFAQTDHVTPKRDKNRERGYFAGYGA
jgi:hypothetical protein